MIESSGIGTYLQNLLPKIVYQPSNIKFNLIGNKEILNQFVWTQKQNIELIHCTVPIYSIKEQLELIMIYMILFITILILKFIFYDSMNQYGGPESFGRVLIESMYLKTLVISTNVGGPK